MAEETSLEMVEPTVHPPSAFKDLKEIIIKEGPVNILEASAGENFQYAEFGRDQIEAALDLLDHDQEIAKMVISEIASTQGVESKKTGNEDFDQAEEEHYKAREEEDGKVIHERRRLYINDKRIPPHSERILRDLAIKFGGTSEGVDYYGEVDATPLYVVLVAEYCKRYGNEILKERYIRKDGEETMVEESVLRAIGWIEKRIAASDIGLLEFKRTNPLGIENQVWTDSSTAYVHTESKLSKAGELANHQAPIAPIEVQGYVYDALTKAAEIFKDRMPDKAKHWIELAAEIQRRTLELFWMEDEQYFASALDRTKDGKLRQVRMLSANAALLLNSDILKNLPLEQQKKYVTGIVRKIFSPEFLTEVGFRCRSLRDKGLVKVKGTEKILSDYHGSNAVWTKLAEDLADGLKRYEFYRLEEQVNDRIINSNNIISMIRSERKAEPKAVIDKPEDKYEFPEFFYVDDNGEVNYDPWGKRLPFANGRVTLFGTNVPDKLQTWSITAVLASKYHQAERKRRSPDTNSWQYQLEGEILSTIPVVKLLRTVKEIEEALPKENSAEFVKIA